MYASKENTDAVQNYSSMVDKDQLLLQQELKDRFLRQFEEGTIDFPPTYKIGTPADIKESTVGSTTRRGYPDGQIVYSVARPAD